MTREKIRYRILDVLTSKDGMSLQIDRSLIDENTSLLRDLNLDSIQILELVVGIEESFNFSLESEELSIDLFDNLGDLIDHINDAFARLSSKVAT